MGPGGVVLFVLECPVAANLRIASVLKTCASRDEKKLDTRIFLVKKSLSLSVLTRHSAVMSSCFLGARPSSKQTRSRLSKPFRNWQLKRCKTENVL